MTLSPAADGSIGFYLTFFARAILGQVMFLSLLGTTIVLCGNLIRTQSAAVRWSCIYIVFSWILTILFHVLATFHLFNFLSALVVSAAIFFFTMYAVPESKAILSDVISGLAKTFSALKKDHASSASLLLIPLLLLAVFHLARILLLPLSGWDSLTYHGLKAAWWVQTGGDIQYDAPGGWEYYRSLFAGGEVFTSWAMLIFHSDALAGLPDLIHWAGLGLITYTLAREFQAQRWAALLIAVMLLTAFETSRYVGSGYVDTGENAMLLGGLAFLCRFFRGREPGDLVTAGAAFGIGIAIKITAMIGATFSCAILFLWLVVHRRFSKVGIPLLFSALVFVLPFARWMALNYLDSGFPFGSTPFAVGSLKLGETAPNLAWFQNRPDLPIYSIPEELKALALSVRSYGFFLALFLLGLPGLLKNFRHRPWPTVLLLGGMAGVIAGYFSPSFSVIRLSWVGVNGRFLLPLMVIPAAAGLNGMFSGPRPANPLYYLAAGLAGMNGIWIVARCFGPVSYREWLTVLCVAGSIVLCVLAIPHLMRRAAHGWPVRSLALIIIATAVFLTVIQYPRILLRYPDSRSSNMVNKTPNYWTGALRFLESEPGEKTVAVTAGALTISHNWFVYPFMGWNLKNRICYVSPERDGRIIPHHPDFLEGAAPDYDRWIQRLRERGVSHVVSFFPPTEEFGWMETHPETFTLLAGTDRKWGLFRFNDSEGR